MNEEKVKEGTSKTIKERQFESAIILLARAIESGRIEGVQKDVESILLD